ncbi:hypothetical protein ACQVQE_29060 [Bacillus mycoides]
MEALDTIRYRLREFRGFVLVVAEMDLAIVTGKKNRHSYKSEKSKMTVYEKIYIYT